MSALCPVVIFAYVNVQERFQSTETIISESTFLYGFLRIYPGTRTESLRLVYMVVTVLIFNIATTFKNNNKITSFCTIWYFLNFLFYYYFFSADKASEEATWLGRF